MRIEAIKTVALMVSLFVIFILSSIKGCDKSCPKIKDGGTTVVHRTDTIYKYMQDTVKLTVKIKEPFIIHDTITKEDLMVYNNSYEDSVLTGNIHSISKGTIIKQELSYILKKPLETIIKDSVFITKTIIVDSTQKAKTQLGIGVQITAPYTMIAAHLYLKSKNNSIFGLGYDVLNKNYSVQFIKILKLRK